MSRVLRLPNRVDTMSLLRPRAPAPLLGGSPTLGWDDHRTFLGAPTAFPMDRVARARADGSLEPVAPRSLSEVPRIYTFVHGWAPGSQAAADLIHASTGTEPRAWDDGIVDLYGVSLRDSFIPVLSAVAAADPEAAVLWFSWVDESATEGEMFAGAQSLAHTQINGARLANALVIACAGPPQRLQLIGHSHGGVVATHAALALPQAPDQLTLLDCPENWLSRVGGSAGLLAEVLPRLEPGRGPGQVFVDSYNSMFGRSYHRHPGLSEVVDVRLPEALFERGPRDAVGDAHDYSLAWYGQTARSADPRCGFGWSVLAAERSAEGPSGAAHFDPEDLEAGYMVQGDNAPVVTSRRPARKKLLREESADFGVGTLELTAERPDVLISVELTDVDLVEFDYQINDGDRRTRVEGAVNRVPGFSGAGGALEVPAWGQYLRIPGNRDFTVPIRIQFRLVEPASNSTATISGVRAVRTGVRTRNYDSSRTAVAIGATGVVVGAVGTLAVQHLVRAVRGQLER